MRKRSSVIALPLLRPPTTQVGHPHLLRGLGGRARLCVYAVHEALCGLHGLDDGRAGGGWLGGARHFLLLQGALSVYNTSSRKVTSQPAIFLIVAEPASYPIPPSYSPPRPHSRAGRPADGGHAARQHGDAATQLPARVAQPAPGHRQAVRRAHHPRRVPVGACRGGAGKEGSGMPGLMSPLSLAIVCRP